jgi:hypothetical protein
MLNKKVLVVDLDGTLYSINTFHHFLGFIILHCIKKFKIVSFLKISSSIMLRIFKITSHSKMKYEILKAINSSQINYTKFVTKIAKFKKDLNVDKSEFDITILATAAPYCYANIIAKNENFDLCIATNFTDSNFNDEFENSKEIKKKNVMTVLMKNEIDKIDTLITDHIDDLPLMKLSQKNMIVSPNKDMEAQLKQHSISYEIIH